MGILFFGLFILGGIYGGGPLSWDELLYLNLSINPEPQTWIFNRYFHIYFQSIFVFLTGHPLIAVKYFWSFLIAVTGFLVYFNARTLYKDNHYWHGLIALLFFFSQPSIFKFNGVTYADFTVMMMVTVGITIYLIYHRIHSEHYRRLLLIAFGLIFLLGFKSKETGGCIIVLLLGFGLTDNSHFDLLRLIKNMVWVVIGVLCGVIIMMILDFIFLGDMWFSLRLSSGIKGLVEAPLGGWLKVPGEPNSIAKKLLESPTAPGDWYFVLMQWGLAMPFTLFLITVRHKLSNHVTRILWLVPLALILILTVRMHVDPMGRTRYLLPAIPVISIFAAQFFRLPDNGISGYHKKIILSFIGAFFLFLPTYPVVKYIASLGHKNQETILIAFINPIALTILLVILLFIKKWDWRVLTLSLACVFLVTLPPIYIGARRFAAQVNYYNSQKRFYPFAAFDEYVDHSENMAVFISNNIYKYHLMLCRRDLSKPNRQNKACHHMFNVFFYQHLKHEQVGESYIPMDLLDGDYTYVFLTKNDWSVLIELGYEDKIKDIYLVETEPQQMLIFLHKKPE